MSKGTSNWEDFGTGFGYWRMETPTNAFGPVETLVHSTSDRDGLTTAQQNSLKMLRELPASIRGDIAKLLAEHFGDSTSEVDFSCDLAEIPLIDTSSVCYAYLDGDCSLDEEHRVTLLVRDGSVLGMIDRDAAGEIFEWDATDEIDALILGGG